MSSSSATGARALITGVAGQDGGYMAEQLVAAGYRVWGLVRPGGLPRAAALPWLQGVELLEGDLADRASLARAFATAEPDEVYNLASVSQPGLSWSDPEASANVNALGPLRLLELVREAGPGRVRLVQASTSEIFGPQAPTPVDEGTRLCPATPYGSAKAYAHQLVGQYRERYGVFACAAILFNHESPRRGLGFVTRKITRGAARIKLGLEQELVLGSLDARRDWGYAPDYVRAMRLMARAEAPADYVVGTGQTHSVRDFAAIAFARVGLRAEDFVRLDPSFSGHSNPAGLAANAELARTRLGWRPTVTFEELVGSMVDADLASEAARLTPA